MIKEFLPWLNKQATPRLVYNGDESGMHYIFFMYCEDINVSVGKILLTIDDSETRFDDYWLNFLPWVEAKLRLDWPKGNKIYYTDSNAMVDFEAGFLSQL